ncbi:GAF domain-containing protein [Nostocaceae cyanobacterium CENA357]|uniref:GAF domain-containing protein n=1 Tax=Atlanticothrix silvestris CENA357 TaxID=1725252 RepID=A0A8J7L431_9CYAN|nr:GAF domain-containing protein [Atlanticothrix silvestris]MBH8554381.1 GAF domain-containing protein [Atlanticothrix silvestris CENA357]
MQIHPHSEFDPSPNGRTEQGLQRVLNSLIKKMHRDALIRQTTNQLRESLQVDRVVLYYFYWQWQGQVTFESLSDDKFSILGSTGADNCFNDEYAALYLAGRVRAIADIELEAIHPCHRDFLRSIQVRANLAVPILIPKGLWGLLVAHHCQTPCSWSQSDVELMQTAAQTLATDSNILES